MEWFPSKRGNYYTRIAGTAVTVFQTAGEWTYVIGLEQPVWSSRSWTSLEKAMKAATDAALKALDLLDSQRVRKT